MDTPNKKRGRKPDGDEKKISVYTYLTPDLLEKVTEEADQNNQTLSKTITQAIEEFFDA